MTEEELAECLAIEARAETRAHQKSEVYADRLWEAAERRDEAIADARLDLWLDEAERR